MYRQMPTGLSPEIVHFNMSRKSKRDIYVKVRADCPCKFENISQARVPWLVRYWSGTFMFVDCVCYGCKRAMWTQVCHVLVIGYEYKSASQLLKQFQLGWLVHIRYSVYILDHPSQWKGVHIWSSLKSTQTCEQIEICIDCKCETRGGRTWRHVVATIWTLWLHSKAKNRECKLQGWLYGQSHNGRLVFSTKLSHLACQSWL